MPTAPPQERGPRPERGNRPERDRGRGKPRRDRKEDVVEEKPQRTPFERKPKPEKPMDPDSPFAKLAALKAQLAGK